MKCISNYSFPFSQVQLGIWMQLWHNFVKNEKIWSSFATTPYFTLSVLTLWLELNEPDFFFMALEKREHYMIYDILVFADYIKLSLKSG